MTGLATATGTSNPRLLGLLSAAEDSRTTGAQGTSDARKCASWSKWVQFCTDIELPDVNLVDFQRVGSIAKRCLFICAFAQWLRFSQRSGGAARTPIKKGTIETALGHVAENFRVSGLADPTKNLNGKTHDYLRQILSGFDTLDPPVKRQKALPPTVIRRCRTKGRNERDRHAGRLIAGAYFFAMRSCEYCKVSGERKTTNVALIDIEFRKGRQVLRHDGTISSLLTCLQFADTVSIIFRLQKNKEKEDTVTMYRARDKAFCPVRAWADIVIAVRSIPGSTDDTPVHTYLDGKATRQVTSDHVRKIIKAVVKEFGKDRLGFTEDEVGTHSIRASTAMALYLSRVPVFVIMLIGRWSSDAFLNYIRKQVQDFSKGVFDAMTQTPDFFTIPTSCFEDPRTRNPLSLSSSNSGLHNGSNRATQPAFHIWT